MLIIDSNSIDIYHIIEFFPLKTPPRRAGFLSLRAVATLAPLPAYTPAGQSMEPQLRRKEPVSVQTTTSPREGGEKESGSYSTPFLAAWH